LCTFSQNSIKDSLYQCLSEEQSKKDRIKLFLEIARINFEVQNDTSILYCQKALEISGNIKKLSEQFDAEIFGTLGQAYENVNKEKSVQYFLRSLPLFNKKNDQKKVYETHIRLCIVYTSINKLEEAKKHLEEAGKIHQESDLIDDNFQLEFATSIYWYTAQNFEKASKAYRELISRLKETDKHRRLSQAYLNLGACYYFLNQSDSCVSTCYKALRLDDKHNFMQPAFRITFLNTIAASYLKVNRIEDAKRVFNQNIEIAQKANITYSLIVGYNNYAYACRLQKEYELSLSALKIARKLIEKNKYVAEKLEIETGIGESLLRLNRIKESIPYIESALMSAKEINNIPLLIENYLNLGDALENDKSIHFYRNALELSEKNKFFDQAYKCSEKIIESSVKDKKSRLISSYYKNLLVLKDSIYNSSKYKEIEEIETKYKTEKKEQQIKLLKVTSQNQQLSIEQAHQEKNMILAGIGILILMFVPVGFYARQRNKNKALEARINSENNECTRIAKELHDGVSGSLTTIRYLLETGTDGNKLMENIESVSNEVRGISHKLNMTALASQSFKQAVSDSLMLSHFPADIDFRINFPEGFEIKVYEKKMNLIRILQELVNNTLKHSEASKIEICFNVERKKTLLTYSDNGLGCKLDEVKKGNGLINIQDRVKVLRGEVKFDSQLGKGFYCQIEI